MKKLILISALFISLFTFAQVPQGISYQAIALNGSGSPVVNSNVRVKLSILDSSASGTVLYSETQLKPTNAQGLFNLVIGQGTLVSGAFNTINWGTNSKFLKVEMDAAGGTTYITVGTTQLLSVPYAMAAGSLAGTSANDSILDNRYSNFAFYSNSNGNVYAFNTNTGTWVPQANGNSTIIESDGNFAFYSNVNGYVYAFNKITGTWIPQSDGGGSVASITASNGSFAYRSSSTGNVYVFNKNTGTWISQTNGGATIIASQTN